MSKMITLNSQKLSEDIQIRLNSANEVSENLINIIGNPVQQENKIYQKNIIHALDDLIAIPDYLMKKLLIQYTIEAKKTHFPLLTDTHHFFRKYMASRYPTLNPTNELYKKLELFQYYHDGKKNEWMKLLSYLGNTSKHNGIPLITFRTAEAVIIYNDEGTIYMRIPEWNEGARSPVSGGIYVETDNGQRKLDLPNLINTKTITKSSTYTNAKNIDYQECYFDYNDKPVAYCIAKILIGIKSMLIFF